MDVRFRQTSHRNGVHKFWLILTLALGMHMGLSLPSAAQVNDERLPIYVLVRSLQLVQDAVVAGDHSAMEMQRYLLEQTDMRLRAARPEEFDDGRNVDAALIYSMSGGNPKTLDLLVARDRYGYFDEDVTKIMRAYLNGLIPAIDRPIEDIIKDYLNTPLGAYIALVGANMKAHAQDKDAIELFNLARLVAPGTLIEESALRRSILMSINKQDVDEAIRFAHIYARRFSSSPYNVQFSQLVIEMIVNNLETIDHVLVDEIISYLPIEQQKRIYLRIARTGVVDGNREMANKAVQQLPRFEGTNVTYYQLMAELYANMANLSEEDINETVAKIRNVRRRTLPPIDRPLYDAALTMAEQILYVPTEESLAQVERRSMRATRSQTEMRSVDLKELASFVEEEKVDTTPNLPDENEFAEFMDPRLSTLAEVDAMLAAELEDIES